MLKFRRLFVILSVYAFSFFHFFALAPIAFLAVPQAALAGAADTGLPWEAPLCSLSNSLTGKTAKAIAMIGLFVAGGLLVFGGELSDFARRITWMCLALSVMLAGGSFLKMINGTGGDCTTP